MKIGVNIGVILKKPYAESLPVAKKYGYEGVQAGMPISPLAEGENDFDGMKKEARKLRELFEQYDLRMTCFETGILPKHILEPSLVEMSMELANIAGANKFRIMGAPYVAYYKPPDRFCAMYKGDKEFHQLLKETREELAGCIEIAKRFRQKLLLELHDGYINCSPSTAERICRGFSPAEIGVIMDPENMIREGNEGWKMGIEILGDYLDHLHVKNQIFEKRDGRWTSKRTSLADGLVDWKAVIAVLKEKGFDGFLVNEDLREDASVEERLGQIEYLKKLLHEQEG
jgi:sugar phosphate isomerase/epimerase